MGFTDNKIIQAFSNRTITKQPKQMLPRKQKDKQWYQDNTDYYIQHAVFNDKTVNYKLYGNVVDKNHFAKYCSDYKFDVNIDEVTHKDIISSKVKVLLGIEDSRPYIWTLAATNPEAVDRKRNNAFKELVDATIKYITTDEEQVAVEKFMQQTGISPEQLQQMPPEQAQQLQQQLQQQIQQIKQQVQAQIEQTYGKWRNMNFKDAIEIEGEHLIRYFEKLNRLEDKFDTGLFHAILTAGEYYYVDVESGSLHVYTINPNNIAWQPSSDSIFIEDAEWVVFRVYLTPSEIVNIFNEYLTKEQIENIYEGKVEDTLESFSQNSAAIPTIPVYRVFWRSLEKIGFLETAEGDIELVDSTYKLKKELGDVKIEWKWVPMIEQCIRIGKDIYIGCHLMRNQVRDIDDLYHVKMPFYGATYDNINANPTSLFDRMVPYQYWYDIVTTHLEKLIYSDEGKKIAINYNMIPTSSGFDVDKFISYIRKNNIIFLDPNEEGSRGDVNTVNAVKEIDLSYAGQIQQYVMLLDYIERRMGESVGITKEMEGIIHQRQAVANTQQAIMQSSKILRPLYALHDEIKRRVLKGILNAAKLLVTYYGKETISYAIDEVEKVVVDLHAAELNDTVFDVFVENNDKLYDIKKAIEQLTQQAMAAGKADFDAVVKVLKTDSVKEAQMILEQAIERANQIQQQMQQQQIQAQQQLEQQKHKWKLEEIKAEGEMQIKREEVKGEYAVKKQAMLSVGFNENKDVDKDKQLDVVELMKKGEQANIPVKQQATETNTGEQ